MAHSSIVRLIAGAAVLSGLGFGGASSVLADSMNCPASGADSAQSYTIVKGRNLFRTQARPFAYIPTGAALLVRAPQHVTEADIYNTLTDCSKQEDPSSPLCVKGASFRVRTEGGAFLVEVTSTKRSTALEIQHRAERFVR